MNQLAHYLQIPEDYARRLGGLRWSAAGDAVEHDEGTVFALIQEIALFLEGFAAGKRLIHFGFILHLMHLLGQGRRPVPTAFLPLRRAFQDAGRRRRNAGAFCAVLCRAIPAIPEQFAFDSATFTNPHLLASHFWVTADAWTEALTSPETPPLGQDVFEGKVLEALSSFTMEELYHWMRHGRGPTAGKPELQRVVEQIQELARPRTLEGVLAELARRPRLAGAVPFVSQMVSALALPPRRLAQPELPLGGYTDVATRGQPEQILPSQFAVDDLEFIRRFAARELLYFRREEPHAQLKEELVVLLDQGVRTWGDVRLVLSAAVFALCKKAAGRKQALHLAVTSGGGRLIDPLAVGADELGELLEASDLSAHPALAVERVLEEPAESPRDVVLLTHPRSLHEVDVLAAARRTAPRGRLFALAVDGHGAARLDELRRGGIVPVSQFRVDLSQAEVVEPPPPALPADYRQFQGEVEPVPFPFRFGLATAVRFMAFDASGSWLLVAGADGMLHAAHLASGALETWPRGMSGGVLTGIDAVLGVAGGFVVSARHHGEFVTAHYRLDDRTCSLCRMAPIFDNQGHWYYFPEHHSVVVRSGVRWFAQDLATGEVCCHEKKTGGRAERAGQQSLDLVLPPPLLDVAYVPRCQKAPTIHVDPHTGAVAVSGTPQVWKPFTPLADGLPVLKGCRVGQAQCAGNVLALTTFDPAQREKVTLRLFRGARAHVIGELPLDHSTAAFALSSQGRRLAVQTGRCEVTVHNLDSGWRPIWTSAVGRCHSGLEVVVGDRWLTLSIGKWRHFVRWDTGRLIHRLALHSLEMVLKEELAGTALYRTGVSAIAPGPRQSTYHRKRFTEVVKLAVTVGVDAFGQVAVLDVEDKLVCMFFVFRNRLAAWMPDGTRLGPATLTGGPETPNALEKISRALLAASMKGYRKTE